MVSYRNTFQHCPVSTSLNNDRRSERTELKFKGKAVHFSSRNRCVKNTWLILITFLFILAQSSAWLFKSRWWFSLCFHRATAPSSRSPRVLALPTEAIRYLLTTLCLHSTAGIAKTPICRIVKGFAKTTLSPCLLYTPLSQDYCCLHVSAWFTIIRPHRHEWVMGHDWWTPKSLSAGRYIILLGV